MHTKVDQNLGQKKIFLCDRGMRERHETDSLVYLSNWMPKFSVGSHKAFVSTSQNDLPSEQTALGFLLLRVFLFFFFSDSWSPKKLKTHEPRTRVLYRSDDYGCTHLQITFSLCPSRHICCLLHLSCFHRFVSSSYFSGVFSPFVLTLFFSQWVSVCFHNRLCF